MDKKETGKRKDKTKSDDHGFAPMGKRMFEMMSACFAGRGGDHDCSAMMKVMMGKKGNQLCCAPGTRSEKNE